MTCMHVTLVAHNIKGECVTIGALFSTHLPAVDNPVTVTRDEAMRAATAERSGQAHGD